MKKSLIIRALRSLEGNKFKIISIQKDSNSHLYTKKRSVAKWHMEKVMLYSNNQCKAHELSNKTQSLDASLQRQSPLEKTDYGLEEGRRDRNKWQIFKPECQRDGCWVSQEFIVVVCKR